MIHSAEHFLQLPLIAQYFAITDKEAKEETIVDSLSVARVNVCGEWRDT